jgi:WD40 repeat protein/tRNA A-37 threonylcarbamoyl transferase component Bud32
MGEVYLAQDEQLKRKVALKLIKGHATKDILRRFHSERQILANLRHPNIAQLYEAGATANGLPYFVMEYVAGRPINNYVSEQNLSLNDRLRLFRTVCYAVSYAHQNLIIHRDLKPGNILVTAEGQPKLLDFGIAKLLQTDTQQEDTTATMFRALTPQYASPEQVKGESISTASDVYSLGVLFYELLTGQRPYKLKSNAAAEITRAICEQEPTRPSAVVSGQSSGVSGKERSAEPHEQATNQNSGIQNPKLLKGDLDNIILKALRKEPHRRYASVEQFSEDIRRHLEGLPVSAHKDSFGYRATKFVTRNKIAVAAVALIVLTLAGGIIATSVGLARARRERTRAETGEATNRHLLYAAQMSLAYQAWETANVGRVLDLLEAQVPKHREEDLRGFEWYLLSRLASERSRVLFTSRVKNWAVAFSPKGDRIAVASGDGNARIWDAATSQLLNSFDGGCGSLGAIAFSPDGNYLVSGCNDGSALIWDLQKGEMAKRLTAHEGYIDFVDFSLDGRLLATASEDRTVKIWDFAHRTELRTLKGHTSYVISIDFSPDGQTLATASADHTAKLWDVSSGKEIATLKGHSWFVNSVAFSPDGKTVATTGSDGEIKFWDASRHTEAATIHGDGTSQDTLRFSPDGKTIAVSRGDGTVKIFDVATRTLRDVLRGHTDLAESLAFSPDGTRLVSASTQVRVWDLTKQPGALALEGHRDVAWQVAFSPEGRTIATASKDGTVRLWNVADGRELASLPHGEWVNWVAFSPDGGRLATADDDTLVRLWNPATGEKVARLSGHTAVAECATFSPDGKLLASGGKTGEIKLWDAATGQELITLYSPNHNLIWSLAFSPDGKYLVAAEGGLEALVIETGHVLTVWDVSSRQLLKTLAGHSSDVRAIAFSPDGKLLASGSFDDTIKLWDVTTWEEVATLKTHKVQGLAFSPDGKRLVSGGRDKTIKIWDVATRQELCTLTTPAAVNAVAFSPDNKVLAVASNDNQVRLWFAASGDGQ